MGLQCSPWYFNSIPVQCGRVIERSGQTIMHCIMWGSIRSYHSQDITDWEYSHSTPVSRTSTGTNIWEIIRPECQTLKSPICHRTTVLYFTAVAPSCWSRAAGLSTNYIFHPSGGSIVVSFEFEDCQSRALAVCGRRVEIAVSRFCIFNNFLVL